MNLSLSEFQDEFISQLYGDGQGTLLNISQQTGFEVYRNTVVKAAVDALMANFPTIERLVGHQWFQAAAIRYAKQSPPSDPRLLFYGAEFPDFLDTFEQANTLPYLSDVARLDLLWIAVHSATEEPGFDIQTFATPDEQTLLSTRLKPKQAARWIWFASHPAYTLWHLNRAQLELPTNLNWQGEGALLTRNAGQVIWHPLSAGGCALLDGCAMELSLERAAELALDKEPDLDLNTLLVHLIAANTFAAAESNQ